MGAEISKEYQYYRFDTIFRLININDWQVTH